MSRNAAVPEFPWEIDEGSMSTRHNQYDLMKLHLFKCAVRYPAKEPALFTDFEKRYPVEAYVLIASQAPS